LEDSLEEFENDDDFDDDTYGSRTSGSKRKRGAKAGRKMKVPMYKV